MNREAEKILENFYQVLDEDALAKLSAEERNSVEQAVLAMHSTSKHKIDFRITFPFLFKRYYLVLFMGQDFRRAKRKESSFKTIFITLMMLVGVCIAFTSTILVLYLIKSALGINIFENFSFGVWDWFKNLIGLR